MTKLTVHINSDLKSSSLVTERKHLEGVQVAMGLLLATGQIEFARTPEGTLEGFYKGMRYCIHPDKLMLTTHSHDSGIALYDEAPELFEALCGGILMMIEPAL